jgi:hypothetical protein
MIMDRYRRWYLKPHATEHLWSTHGVAAPRSPVLAQDFLPRPDAQRQPQREPAAKPVSSSTDDSSVNASTGARSAWARCAIS